MRTITYGDTVERTEGKVLYVYLGEYLIRMDSTHPAEILVNKFGTLGHNKINLDELFQDQLSSLEPRSFARDEDVSRSTLEPEDAGCDCI